jgi:shikimate kinase
MRAYNGQRAKDLLKHVYWLGGASSAGKTTISKRLADDLGLVRYDGDAHCWERINSPTKKSPLIFMKFERI